MEIQLAGCVGGERAKGGLYFRIPPGSPLCCRLCGADCSSANHFLPFLLTPSQPGRKGQARALLPATGFLLACCSFEWQPKPHLQSRSCVSSWSSGRNKAEVYSTLAESAWLHPLWAASPSQLGPQWGCGFQAEGHSSELRCTSTSQAAHPPRRSVFDWTGLVVGWTVSPQTFTCWSLTLQ